MSLCRMFEVLSWRPQCPTFERHSRIAHFLYSQISRRQVHLYWAIAMPNACLDEHAETTPAHVLCFINAGVLG
jgi:hypothetical protein